MQNNWFTKDFSTVAQEYCSRCMICAINNGGKGQAMKLVGYPSPDKSFSHVMIDNIELTPSEGKKYCVVAVDIMDKSIAHSTHIHANETQREGKSLPI